MVIERHVFGSFKGYTTLARSPGISADDARLLEGAAYGFGQTEDRKYLKSLRASPAYFTRSLRGNRRALTRVLEGKPDDNGRATLLMITAVLNTADWDGKLLGDISTLLKDEKLWEWTSGSTINSIEKSYPPASKAISRKSAAKVAGLISELERRAGSHGPIVVGCDQFDEEELQAVEALIPPTNRGQYSTGARSLSPQLSVTINLLAAEAPSQKVTFRLSGADSLSPYGQFLMSKGLADGKIPFGDVLTYRSFGRVVREPGSPKGAPAPSFSPPPPPEERNVWVRWSAIAASIVIAFFLGMIVGRRAIQQAPAVLAATRPVATPQAALAKVPVESTKKIPTSQAPSPPAQSQAAKPATQQSSIALAPATHPDANHTEPVTKPASVVDAAPKKDSNPSTPAIINDSKEAESGFDPKLFDKAAANELAKQKILSDWKARTESFRKRPIDFEGNDGEIISDFERRLEHEQAQNLISTQDGAEIGAAINLRTNYLKLQFLVNNQTDATVLKEATDNFQKSVDRGKQVFKAGSALSADPLVNAQKLLDQANKKLEKLSSHGGRKK